VEIGQRLKIGGKKVENGAKSSIWKGEKGEKC
jgi:hypothetical protein